MTNFSSELWIFLAIDVFWEKNECIFSFKLYIIMSPY